MMTLDDYRTSHEGLYDDEWEVLAGWLGLPQEPPDAILDGLADDARLLDLATFCPTPLVEMSFGHDA